MNPSHLGTILVAISAAGFATLSIFIKIAYSSGANLITIITFRFLLASLMLWIVLKLRNISPDLDRTTIVKLCLLGVFGYGVMSALFAGSLAYLSASLSTMMLYTYPAIVTILSFVIGDEKFNKLKGLALTTCFAGLILILGVSFQGLHPLGITLGLGAAIVYSIYIIVSNRLLKNLDPIIVTTYICTATAITYLLVSMLSGTFDYHLPLSGWLAIGGIAFFATVIAVLCFFAGMRKVGASNASIISTLEPVTTVILSFFILGEKITPLQLGGGILILIGVIYLQKLNDCAP